MLLSNIWLVVCQEWKIIGYLAFHGKLQKVKCKYVFGYMQVSDQILCDKTEDEIQWNLRVVINISIVKNVGDTECFVT